MRSKYQQRGSEVLWEGNPWPGVALVCVIDCTESVACRKGDEHAAHAPVGVYS